MFQNGGCADRNVSLFPDREVGELWSVYTWATVLQNKLTTSLSGKSEMFRSAQPPFLEHRHLLSCVIVEIIALRVLVHLPYQASENILIERNERSRI